MTMSLPPGFTTRKISRMSSGKSGHQKCVSTAVTRSNMPSGKRQLRHGSVPNLHVAHFDRPRVGSLAGSDARFGKVGSVDLSLRSHRGQLADRSAASTAYVEDRVALVDRHMYQAPIRYLGVARIHVPQDEPAQPSSGLLALACRSGSSGHSHSPNTALREN